MINEIDSGDIIAQADISLLGTLTDILTNIENVGTRLTLNILTEGLHPVPQDHSKATYFKRRAPEESEITIEEIKERSAEYLFDKIRMLAPPYPSAFIYTSDGEKLIIKSAEINCEN